jgi:hypothetical protein
MDGLDDTEVMDMKLVQAMEMLDAAVDSLNCGPLPDLSIVHADELAIATVILGDVGGPGGENVFASHVPA